MTCSPTCPGSVFGPMACSGCEMEGDVSVPRSIRSEKVTMFGIDIVFHVLSDGRRVIEKKSLVKIFEAMGKNKNFMSIEQHQPETKE